MAIEIDSIQTSKAIGWADARLARLAAGSIGNAYRMTYSGNGAASAPPVSITGTIFSGGTATTTKPQFLVEPSGTTSTGWSTAGTLIGANASSGFTGNVLDLQVNGVQAFRANYLGVLFLGNGSTGAIAWRSDVDMLMLHKANTAYGVVGIGATGFQYGINLSNGAALGFTNDTPASTRDVILLRDAPNTLALRNSTNAQAFNIYNTYTSGSVYERGFMRWVSNALEIGMEHVGASNRSVKLIVPHDLWIGTAASPVGRGYINSGGLSLPSSAKFGFSATADASGPDTGLGRVVAAVIGINNGSTGGGALGLVEMTSPAAPATNGVYIFAEDNGSGKTRLMARFATGATQQLAIEP